MVNEHVYLHGKTVVTVTVNLYKIKINAIIKSTEIRTHKPYMYTCMHTYTHKAHKIHILYSGKHRREKTLANLANLWPTALKFTISVFYL